MIFLRKCRVARTFLLTIIILNDIIGAKADNNSDTICIRVEGFAEGPSYLVRQMALGEAQKNALEQYLLSLLPEKYLNYLKPIFNKASLYIRTYKILYENTTNDKSVIEIEAELSDELINKDVTTLLIPHITNLPKISLFIIDIHGLSEKKTYTESINAYEVIEEKMENLKFIIQRTNIENNFNESEVIQMIQGGLEDKKKMAMSQDADIFVFGINQYELLGDLSQNQIQKIRCTLTMELFRVSDGKLLDAFSMSASVRSNNLSEARKQSAEDCAIKSIQKIITCSFLSSLNDKRNIKYVYLYFDNFKDKSLIKDVVDYLETATYGSRTECVFETQKKAKYRLMFDGPIVHIVDSISNNKSLMNKIIIKKVVERDIFITFSGKN